MKMPLNRSAVAVFVATSLMTPRPGFAAGLTVNPPAVSNTNGAAITLNITGLTNHEPVTVETYFDFNNNSVLDAGDLLLDQFGISESGATTIGGITNLNVPFDSNSATDAITTALSFAPSIESTVVQRIYRVTSPSSRFTPVTATFNVTNAALNQAVAGTVFAGGTPLPGAIVVALEQPNFRFTSAALSDGSGNYFLKLPAGTYAVLPTKPGYYTDQSQVTIVALTNGVMATNSVFMTNGSVTISGQVYDSVSSNALPGVFLQFESQNLFGLAFTDASGNFSAGATSNFWSIRLDGDRIARRGYVRPQGAVANVDTTLGSVSNVNIALLHGNALFYGRVTNQFGAPLANISIGANDTAQMFEAQGFTDANGYYSVAVLVDTNNFPGTDFWRVSPNNDNPELANYVVSQSNDVSLTNNQASLQNFGVLPVTGRISGRLQDNLGASVSGVSVGANANIGGASYTTTYVNTDGNGEFSLPAANGQWSVNVNCCGSEGLDSHGLYDPAMQHNVTIPPTNQVVNITVYPVGTPFLTQPTRFSPTEFNFFMIGGMGNNYTIQATTNLSSTNWFTVMAVTNVPGNFFFIQDFQATNGQRFYRALRTP